MRRCLLIDEDPQGSLTLWNALRGEAALPIKAVKRELADVLKKAKRRDVDWVFVDTPANVSASVVEVIQAARLVIIPCRPGLLDIERFSRPSIFPVAWERPMRSCSTVLRRGAGTSSRRS
jgi:chromosome partitioning protein